MGTQSDRLHLYEELLLLALQDERGRLAYGTWPAQAIAGGVLAELLLEERLRFLPGGTLLEVVDRAPLGDPLLDETLELVAASSKRRRLSKWITRVSGRRCLPRRASAGLLERGVLRLEQRRVLGIFPRRSTPLADRGPKDRLLERLARALENTRSAPDPRTILALSLARSTGVLKRALGADTLRRHRARLEELVSAEVVGAATRKVVEELEAAIVVAAVVPVIAS